MRVLHLGKLCPPREGGIEVFSFDLINYLNQIGVKADLLCFGEKNGEFTFKNFKYFETKMNLKVSSAPISFEFLRKGLSIAHNYDIIHIHSPNPLAEILSLFIKRPLIIHWHSDIVRQKILYHFYKPIQKAVLNKAIRIITTSPHYKDTSRQLEDFRQKCVVIPLGIDLSKYEDYVKTVDETILDEINAEKRIILSIGRFVEYKGFRYLVKAAKYLREDAVVMIVGHGPLLGKIKELIKREGLREKVILAGRVDDVRPYIQRSYLFCLPSISRNEAFGLVLLEALFYGKPLITTAVEGSGMNYVNHHGKTGFVVPPKDPKALADAINKLLDDRQLYDEFSKNARERFKEFEMEKIGQKIIRLYEEILSDRLP